MKKQSASLSSLSPQHRSRKTIEKRIRDFYGDSQIIYDCTLEVLLDIRDLLTSVAHKNG
jgi:hypothetical protein